MKHRCEDEISVYHRVRSRIEQLATRFGPLSATAIVVLCVIARTLLWPEGGTGILDRSLIGLLSSPAYFGFLVMVELLAGIALTMHLRHQSRIRAPAALLLGFSLVIAVRSVYATDPGGQYIAANIILGYVILLTSFWLGQESRVYNKAFPSLLLGVFAMYGARSLLELLVHPRSGHRLDIAFNHPNHLGNLLAFALVYCFSIAVSARGRKQEILSWTLAIALCFALAHTLSRGAWLGCLIGLAASTLYSRTAVSSKRIALGFALLAVVVAGVLVGGSTNRLAERFSPSSPDVQYSVGNRALVWRYTTDIARNHWLTGVGLASLGPALKSDRNVQFRNGESFASAMNNYLTLSAEAGIPAMILYLVCIIFTCVLASRSVTANLPLRGANAGMLCGVYSMLAFAFTTYTLGRAYATVLVWSALGYIISQGPASDRTAAGTASFDIQATRSPRHPCAEHPSNSPASSSRYGRSE